MHEFNSQCSNQIQNEKQNHMTYLKKFRCQQCPLFLEHKCQQHRPFSCFNWHFPNQRRRQVFIQSGGTFNYNPDVYCQKYDENSGVCPNGDKCAFVHRNAGDTERRYHPRYYKTGVCLYDTTDSGHCAKNGTHCPFAHTPEDIRQPSLDYKSTAEMEQQTLNLPASLEKERVFSEDKLWNDLTHVLNHYKTEACNKPPRMCRQGYACPYYHNEKDKRRSPALYSYRSTPCPHVKSSDEWKDSANCEEADNCAYCHTRTEQQFHPEIYKTTKCNDMIHNSYCPRGPFCAFAHSDIELTMGRDFVSSLESTTSLGKITEFHPSDVEDIAPMISPSDDKSGCRNRPGIIDHAGTYNAIMASSTQNHHNCDATTQNARHVLFQDSQNWPPFGNIPEQEDCWNDEQLDKFPDSFIGSDHFNGECCADLACSPRYVTSGFGSLSQDEWLSSCNTTSTAPVNIPRVGQRHEDRFSISSGLGGSLPFGPCPHSTSAFNLEQLSNNGRMCQDRKRSLSGSYTNLPQSPILMQSPFSNPSGDLEKIAMQKELEDCRHKLNMTEAELDEAKRERDMCRLQLSEYRDYLLQFMIQTRCQNSTSCSQLLPTPTALCHNTGAGPHHPDLSVSQTVDHSTAWSSCLNSILESVQEIKLGSNSSSALDSPMKNVGDITTCIRQ